MSADEGIYFSSFNGSTWAPQQQILGVGTHPFDIREPELMAQGKPARWLGPSLPCTRCEARRPTHLGDLRTAHLRRNK
jgi:hypothetical protein